MHRRGELRASKVMADRLLAEPNVEVHWNKVVTALHGEATLESATLTDTVTGETSTLPVSGLFVAIGHDPRSAIVRGEVAVDDAGYILVDEPSTRTNAPGVFAAGDVVDHTYRQAVTAAGSGCRAALDAQSYLEGLA